MWLVIPQNGIHDYIYSTWLKESFSIALPWVWCLVDFRKYKWAKVLCFFFSFPLILQKCIEWRSILTSSCIACESPVDLAYLQRVQRFGVGVWPFILLSGPQRMPKHYWSEDHILNCKGLEAGNHWGHFFGFSPPIHLRKKRKIVIVAERVNRWGEIDSSSRP